MRQICKSCPAHNNMSAYHCKGDDENCEEVMRYDEGFEAGFDACRDKAMVAFCKAKCPQNCDYCWMDSTDEPCKEFDQFVKLLNGK